MAKKKKKRVFKVKNIILFFVLFCGIFLLIYYGITMPVKNIYVKGNQIVSDQEILQLSGLDQYPSFLLTSYSSIRKGILKSPYVGGVRVHKKMGNIVVVDISEYSPICLFGDSVILENGQVLENQYHLSDVPLLLNEIADQKIYSKFVKKMGSVDQNILRQVSEIEYRPLEVDEERFLLYMNDGNLVYITLTKILKLNKYNQIRDKLDGHTGIIYLDSGDYVEIKN